MTTPASGAPSAVPPAPMRTCQSFSEDLHLLADGELGPAEQAIVEAHLLACANCQVVAARLERMSSLLKAWDSETNDHVAPALRLQHAVLSRVTEQSAVRRREGRMVGVRQYATAALVLLAIGAAALLGLGQKQPRPVAPTFTADERPWPLEERRGAGFDFPVAQTRARLDLAALGLAALGQGDLPALAPMTTKDIRWDATVPADSNLERSLALLDLRITRAATVARALGGPVMYWAGPFADERPTHLVTQRAYRFLHERGLLEAWSRFDATSGSSTEEVTATRLSTGRTARELLTPMPGVDRPLSDLFQRGGRLSYVPGRRATSSSPLASKKGSANKGKAPASKPRPRALLEAWPLEREAGLRSTPLSAAGSQRLGRFLDPLAAAANGNLHLDDSQSGADTVIAIVKDTVRPIFIPAGQFLSGGFADRVVAQPIWLPPSKGKTPHVIPCRVVQSFVEGKGAPTLSRYVAGPTIRALLASGASQEVVKEAARRIVALRSPERADSWDAWSLLDVYGNTAAAKNYEFYRKRINWKGRCGFVVSDAQGALVGFECVKFEGEASQELLMRLWMGYVTEAVLRGRPKSSEALAPSSDALSQAFRRVVSSVAEFRMPAGFDPSQGWRVSSLEIYATGLHLQALELGERAVVVSGLSGLSPR